MGILNWIKDKFSNIKIGDNEKPLSTSTSTSELRLGEVFENHKITLHPKEEIKITIGGSLSIENGKRIGVGESFSNNQIDNVSLLNDSGKSVSYEITRI
ncbi:hypothetical protein [uncultured Thiothrix sp.]|jgi:hypothetical protein|uniref:hypothetical protein n=1 Tax=uncultured Thiothrix sp. TaxID=223185 RepID=UPI0026241FAE|nr:hypothetical protein [uncultured Thiothrix sp.]HMT93185.1 hypothetical protein [Thiolinea sp.]